MTGITTDQYVTINDDCPISTDVDSTQEAAVLNFGPLLGHGNTLQLTMTNPDTCRRLAEAAMEARARLVHDVLEHRPEHAEELAVLNLVDRGLHTSTG